MIVCDSEHLGLIDATARRNAFGRQLQSFEAELDFAGVGDEPVRAVFIRAPWIERSGPGVEVLAEWEGHPVAIREGDVLACSFHPELTDDSRVHALLMAMATSARERADRGGGPMRDPRIDRLARVIVRYSLELREGQTFLISSGAVAEPLVQALYEEALDAGAHPMLDLSLEGTQTAFFRLANDEQLDWVSPTQRWAFEHADARMRILSDTNTRELSGVPPGEADPAPEGDAPLHDEDDGAQRRRGAALERDAVPDQRLRVGRRR